VIAEQAAATRVAPRTGARARHLTALAVLAVLAVVGAWQLLTALQTSPYQWHDFAQDYIAAEDVLAGRNPFRPQNERVGQLFNMPAPDEGPAYIFLPLGPLPYTAAFVVWDLIQLLCLWAIVDLTARALGRRLPAVLGAGVALALVAGWPIRESFVEGQLNVPVAAGIVPAGTPCGSGGRPGPASLWRWQSRSSRWPACS
jgi:hypothetical protein